jgi:hypothetical protein
MEASQANSLTVAAAKVTFQRAIRAAALSFFILLFLHLLEARVMADLTNPKLIYLKGGLFVLTGLMASLLLILEYPTLKTAVLLGVAVWCFARAYYFAFYVIEHYVDPGFRFAGLGAFVQYLVRKRWPRDKQQPTGSDPHGPSGVKRNC